MTMKAVGTAAMEMVQEVEIQFDEVREHSWCHIIVVMSDVHNTIDGCTGGVGGDGTCCV